MSEVVFLEIGDGDVVLASDDDIDGDELRGRSRDGRCLWTLGRMDRRGSGRERRHDEPARQRHRVEKTLFGSRKHDRVSPEA